MKTNGFFSFSKKIILTVLVIMMIFSFSSLSAQTNFLISSVVPAARGTVNVNKDRYNNYVIRINIENLAEAGRLQPPKNTYVVWMAAEDSTTKNIGQIRTTVSFLMKKLNATFETKSSFKPVKIFISAEYDPNLQYPSKEIVLTTGIFDLPKQ